MQILLKGAPKTWMIQHVSLPLLAQPFLGKSITVRLYNGLERSVELYIDTDRQEGFLREVA